MAANSSCFAHFRSSPLRVLPGGLQAEPTDELEGEECRRATCTATERTEEAEERAPASRTFRVDATSPDDVLAMAAAGGNHRAAAIIVRRYTPKVRSRLQQWMGPVDLDDHVQNTFIRLFEQLPRLRDPSALRGFLVGITLRIACSELRRRRRSRTQLTATGDVPEPEVMANDSEPAREALWRFESIVGRLAPNSRRVFMLRYVEKLELTDIAAEMGISVATVKRHFARAASAVAAMVTREPALAEYLPTAVDASEGEVSAADSDSEEPTSPTAVQAAAPAREETKPSPAETGASHPGPHPRRTSRPRPISTRAPARRPTRRPARPGLFLARTRLRPFRVRLDVWVGCAERFLGRFAATPTRARPFPPPIFPTSPPSRARSAQERSARDRNDPP